MFDLINPSGQRVPLAVREVPNQAVFKIPQLTSRLVGILSELTYTVLENRILDKNNKSKPFCVSVKVKMYTTLYDVKLHYTYYMSKKS